MFIKLLNSLTNSKSFITSFILHENVQAKKFGLVIKFITLSDPSKKIFVLVVWEKVFCLICQKFIEFKILLF